MTPVWFHHNDGASYYGLVRFISERIWGKARSMGQGTGMAVVNGEKVVAGALFHNLDADSGVIEISAASDSKRWLTRPILFEMFSFVFSQLNCQAAILRTDPQDKALARILSAYGFARYDIPRLRGRNKPEALFVLGDDEWRKNGFHKEHRNG